MNVEVILNPDFALNNYLNTKSKLSSDLSLGVFKMLPGMFY